MSLPSLRAIAPILILTAAALAGCSGPSVPMQAAEDAGNPACADVSVRLPERLDSLELRHTNAQATGAWGNPAAVLLRCGVTPPPPTDEVCLAVDGIDWIEDGTQAPTYRYTTYGRDPAVEVVIDSSTGVSGLAVLVGLAQSVSYIPQERQCLGAEDVLGVPDLVMPEESDAPEQSRPEEDSPATNEPAE